MSEGPAVSLSCDLPVELCLWESLRIRDVSSLYCGDEKGRREGLSLVILLEATKSKSQSHTSKLALTVLTFFCIFCTEKLVERSAASQAAGRSPLPPRPAWKKEGMGEKQPKKDFLHFELQLHEVSGGTWKH